MSNTRDWKADIEREVNNELGVVLGYCLSPECENYAMLPAHTSAATTLIACFVEPDCSVDGTKLMVHEKCLIIGVSLADIQSAIDSNTVDRSLSESEAIGLYIEQLGDDPSFLSSRSNEVNALALLHEAEKLLRLPHNHFVLRNDYAVVGGDALSNAISGVRPKPTSGLQARPPFIQAPGALLSNDQIVTLWRLIEVQVLHQAGEIAQKDRNKTGKVSVTTFAVRKFVSDLGLARFCGENNSLSGELCSAIAQLLSIVLRGGVGQDEVRKTSITN